MRMERTVREIAGDYAVLENGQHCRGHGADF